MPEPKRIQRKRTKGWEMPPNTVYVGRPSKWGNPWKVEEAAILGLYGDEAARVCVEAYRAWLLGRPHYAHAENLKPAPDVSELRGKDLVCWCGEYDHCHADVLLELANK